MQHSVAPHYLLTLLLSLSQVQSNRELTECTSHHHQSALSLHTAHQCNLVTEVVKLDLPTEGNIIQVSIIQHNFSMNVISSENDSFFQLTSNCMFYTCSGDSLPRQCQEMSRFLSDQSSLLLQTPGVHNEVGACDDGGGRVQHWLAGDRLSEAGGEGGPEL